MHLATSVNRHFLLAVMCCLALLSLFSLPSAAFEAGMAPVRLKAIASSALDSIGEQWSIAQDQQGFMWFGGSSGLARFDGNSTLIFRHEPKSPQSLSNNYITDLLVDAQGRIWIATRDGLNRYLPADNTFVRYQHQPGKPDSISYHNISALHESPNGNIWVATNGGGLNLFDPKTESFKHFQHDASDSNTIASNNIKSVYVDHQGHVWICFFDAGLDRLDTETGTVTHFTHEPENPLSLSHNSVWSFFEDSQQRLWLGTRGGGLNRLDPATGNFYRYRYHPEGSENIQDIAEYNDGTLWIATGDGLKLFEPTTGRFIDLGPARNATGNFVRSLFQDKDGDWWFGHFPFGVSKSDPYASAFHNYQHQSDNENSLSNNAILSIAEDDRANLWIGTEDGLNHLNRHTGTFTRYTPGAAVLDVAIDSNNELWLGSWGDGLSHFDNNMRVLAHYKPEPTIPYSLSGDRVWAIYEDSQHNLWAGTESGGLNYYDRNTDRFFAYHSVFNDPTSITSSGVVAFLEDSKGNFWVGTWSGLNLMDRAEGTFTRFEQHSESAHSLRHGVWTIVEGSKGNLWIGTKGGGLNKFNPETQQFTAYLTSDGLPSDSVTGIQEDDQGNLWLGTEGGLSRFNPKTGQFRNFSTEHGLPDNVFNRPASLKTQQGELVFGSTNGLTIFNPANIFEDTTRVPVVLTDFQLFNRPVVIGDENSPLQQSITQADQITLAHNQSVFSLSYAALNYRIPEKNQYAYKLEGFDSEWNNVGNQRSATYTNLDPGKYIFRVKAASSDGVWNEQGTSIEILVLPPWWQTWWAYSFYVLTVVLAFAYYVYSNQKKLAYVEKVVEERTQALIEANLRLKRLGNTDPLTGLNNRRLFDKRSLEIFQSAVRGGLDFSVVIMDIDHFKKLNDTYGHDVGDQALIHVANTLTHQVVRKTDVLARIGGEEFGLILQATSLTDATQIAHHLCEKVATCGFEINGQSYPITMSFGVSGISGEELEKHTDMTVYDLTKLADNALYKSKHNGRNQVTSLQWIP